MTAIFGWMAIAALTLVIGGGAQYIIFRGEDGWGFIFRWPGLWLIYFFLAHSIFEGIAARIAKRQDSPER